MPPELRFRDDGSFTIVQFTDTHFRNGEPPDQQTTALMRAVLEAEQPDLVILNGDVIDGSFCQDPAASWMRAVAPVLARGLPWATVFGNHDDEGALDRRDLMALQRDLPGCLSQFGPPSVTGVGNYVLPVWSAVGDRPAAHVYCLDSNAYAPPALGGYGWIARDQIAWYTDAARALAQRNGGAPLPALMFFHIPLPEHDEVWDFHPCAGVKYEPVCCPRINTGLFAALYELGEVMGVFVGHDHVNDYIGALHGIRLGYGRGTGYNTYGREGFARGARVIRLREGERDFTTWLRLEGGAVISEPPIHTPTGARTLSA
jgi:3',5'-cyclic AMP phosphodiesterase CpdA